MVGPELKPTSSASFSHAQWTHQPRGRVESGGKVDVEHVGSSQQEQRVKAATPSCETQMKKWLSQSQYQLLLKVIQTFLKVWRNVSYFPIYFLLKILGIKKNFNLVNDSVF